MACGKTAELNQPIYFKDVLTSEWKSRSMLCWSRGYAFVSTGSKKSWIPSKLIKIRFDREIFAIDMKEETKENSNTGGMSADLCGDSSETGRHGTSCWLQSIHDSLVM